MNNRKKRIQLWLSGIICMSYLLLYLVLRLNGFITHVENRGMARGDVVRAQISEWNDLGPEPLARMERATVKTVNVLFFPLRKVEEICHQHRSCL
ncbi:hypothetical protein P3T73_15190 [Kiritimatiellota bacterium B12222]|nr:hypothetical protein P3T73_15190 [Kiritimatiellota bacterium B12222]